MTNHKQIVYPADANVILDVTKAPYFLDNTGQKDCTSTLIKILDQIAQHSLDGMKRVMDILESNPEKDYLLPNSFENAKRNGKIFGIFPDPQPPSQILYFPKGVYLVSDTICYSFDNLVNGMNAEINWRMRMIGESQGETILKLKDGSHGFEYGTGRPVISFIRGRDSNISMSNFLRNLTIDIGAGNAGAVGVEFFGCNCAGMENVTIRTSDPEYRGHTGLSVCHDRATGCVFQNISIDGFDDAARFHSDSYLVCENINLKNQREKGISIQQRAIISIRGLFSENKVPALRIKGHSANVVLLDAKLQGTNLDAPAIQLLDGQVLLRNIQTTGYHCALGGAYSHGWGCDAMLLEPYIQEFVSGGITTLSEGQEKCSLNISVEKTPEFATETDFSEWVHPSMFGAVGDGKQDDTIAIQKAMDSGKSIIYFQQGRYLINAPIRIPASVQQINFMFVDFVAGEALKQMTNQGMFTVIGESTAPLLIEDVFSFEENYGFHYFIDHASTRTLVLKNIHTQSCASYRNSVPGGTVFLDNCVSTTGIFNETYQQPCFFFQGQKAYCIQIDPEYTPDKIINDASTLVILGYKTEGHGAAIITRNGGRTEAFGGFVLFGPNNDTPLLVNDNSDMAINLATSGTFPHHLFQVPIMETIQGATVKASYEIFPKRFNQQQYFIPLYVGRKRVS